MHHISYVYFRPVINTNTPAGFLDLFHILFLGVMLYVSQVKMLTGLLLNENCKWSWITAVTLVAAVQTWKSAALPASHFRRLF